MSGYHYATSGHRADCGDGKCGACLRCVRDAAASAGQFLRTVTTPRLATSTNCTCTSTTHGDGSVTLNRNPGCSTHGLGAHGGLFQRPKPGPAPYDGLAPELVPNDHMIGLRTWRIDDLGRLFPVNAARTPWRPGENVALCSNGTHPGSIHGFDPACKCGFYAFHNGDNDFNGPGQITGIVKGYGRTVVGTKGFRCEKAEIVALVMPIGEPEPPVSMEPKKIEQPWWFMPLTRAPFIAGPLVGSAAAFGLTRVDGYPGNWVDIALTAVAWVLAALVAGALTAVGVTALLEAHDDNQRLADLKARADAAALRLERRLEKRELAEPEPVPMDVARRVRIAYPDVKVYTTLAEAVAAHPLTPPAEPPVPQPGDETFWSMPPLGLRDR